MTAYSSPEVLAKLPKSTEDYRRVLAYMKERTVEEQTEQFRWLCQNDLYYLLRFALSRVDMGHPWVFARCREVQAEPNGRLDLWAREHYKSTVITFGLTIMEILNDPDTTIGIFSHTRPIAKAFLRQIKREFESNEKLKAWFPEIFYANPSAESPKWSDDEGIIVRRPGNPKEATVEAWGVVDGQPTGKHFKGLVYDDLVTIATVGTPDQIQKAMSALEISYNLGSDGGWQRMIGTRYHFNDPYRQVMERGTFKARIHAGTDDGTPTGKPVMWTQEVIDKKRRDYGPFNFAAQILLNPVAEESQGFRRDWLRYYKSVGDAQGMNKIILVDPANSKKKTSDYTAMLVIALGRDRNVYVLDIIRDRLNLTQRTSALFALHRLYKPIETRYERYGMQADIDHIRDVQETQNYRFDIKEVGGPTPKLDRIRRLIPWFEQGRIWFPKSLHKACNDGRTLDMVLAFVEEEYAGFPVSLHDDMLDDLARIADPDMPLPWPMEEELDDRTEAHEPDGDSWMAA